MEDNLTYEEFISRIKRVSDTRHHSINNSYGVYDAYKAYRKGKPKDKRYILTESQYFSIIRRTNELLGEALTRGEDIILPMRMGVLELRKLENKVYFKDGKVKTTYAIDWDKTLKLWYEDKEAFSNKTLIRAQEKEKFKVYYNKYLASYTNKSFYQFHLNRNLKLEIKENIRKGILDAYLIKY